MCGGHRLALCNTRALCVCVLLGHASLVGKRGEIYHMISHDRGREGAGAL